MGWGLEVGREGGGGGGGERERERERERASVITHLYTFYEKHSMPSRLHNVAFAPLISYGGFA